jgi:hypothetical protein
MRLIDKLYYYFYWCWNTDKECKFVDSALNKSIMLVIWGLLFFITSLVIPYHNSNISIFKLFLGVGITSFFIAKFTMKRYDNERRKRILDTYEKPGNEKYLVYIFTILFAVLFLISSYLLVDYLYTHR